MKTITIAFFFVSVFFAAPVVAQGYQLKFKIINNTGDDLFGVFVSDTETDDWGEDIIPYDIFESGTMVNVTIPINDQTLCEYDIRIEENSDDSVVFEGLDFCDLSVLTLTKGRNGVIYYTVE
ncbi:MAG TPA: hypothetical protein VKX40_05890 [Aequorivita sp.]|nr:hypothetical protein [Aequorivita sp.]